MMEMEKDITDKVQERQLTWFGQTNRMDETRWPRKVLEWVPQEKGKRGRQRRGWRDDIKQGTEARGTAEEGCYGREEWRVAYNKRRHL
jgi:predicted transposase YdaD